MDLKKVPMSNETINKYLPDVHIITNRDINDVDDVKNLFPNWNNRFVDSIIVLFLDDENSGHWTALSKIGYDDKKTGGSNKNKKDNKVLIEFFDSYGGSPNDVYNYVPMDKRKELKTDTNKLTELLLKCPYTVSYNPIDYQKRDASNNIATCGRHCSFRIIKLKGNGYILPEYYDYMKKAKKHFNCDYDDLVSLLINMKEDD